MRRRIRNPYFRLPSDLVQVSTHDRAIRKSSHIDYAGLCPSKKVRQLKMTLAIDWPVRGHGLDQKKPIAFGVVQYDIRHLSVGINIDTQLCE